MAFISGHWADHWWQSQIQTQGLSDDKYHDCVINESQLLHSLFASLLSFALCSRIQSKTCCREEYDRCKIQFMVKICLNFATFEWFATAVLWTVAKGCFLSHDHFFFETVTETGNSEQWLLYSAVSNLLANCWPTGYRHITDTSPTVSRHC